MKKHRLFLAINLPSGIKERLLGYQEEYSELPVRWTPQANLHITLIFLGETDSDEIQYINENLEKVSESSSGFSCRLKKVVLAPPGSTPRMFWVRVGKSDGLMELQRRTEKKLKQEPGVDYQGEDHRKYLPHITLGRINQDKWNNLRERPRVTETFDLKFYVDSFALMESELKPSGAEYQLRKSYSLT